MKKLLAWLLNFPFGPPPAAPETLVPVARKPRPIDPSPYLAAKPPAPLLKKDRRFAVIKGGKADVTSK